MIMNRDVKVMKLARRLAIDNYGVKDRFKLTSIITYKRDIISIGNNILRTHPLQKQFAKNSEAIYLHAEINAISNALNHIDKSDLKKCTLYIHRVKRNDSNKLKAEWVDGLACPCSGCKAAIISFEIPRIIYSTNENNKYIEFNIDR